MEWERGKKHQKEYAKSHICREPSAFQRSFLRLCCLGHIATNASNGGTLEQPYPEESIGLLTAVLSWGYRAPPSLTLKYRVVTQWARPKWQGRQFGRQGSRQHFPFPKKHKAFSKANGIKMWASSPPPCDKRMGRTRKGRSVKTINISELSIHYSSRKEVWEARDILVQWRLNTQFPVAKREKQVSWDAGSHADGRWETRQNLVDDASPGNRGAPEATSRLQCWRFWGRQQLSKHLAGIIWAVKNYPQKSRKLVQQLKIY